MKFAKPKNEKIAKSDQSFYGWNKKKQRYVEQEKKMP